MMNGNGVLVALTAVLVLSAGPAHGEEGSGQVSGTTGIRPLANEFVVVFESPDPKGIYCYSPGLTRCPSGRLVATMDRGGHFAALEQPQVLAEDVRAFFRTLRS